MIYKLLYISLFLFLSSCSLFSGNDNKKEDACDWPPGNRNYSWRIDTVGYWPSTLGGLYVFNDSTAFITGRVNTKDRRLLAGLRWNGTAWLQDIYSPLPEFPIGHYGLDAAGDDSMMVSVGYWDLNNGFKSAIGEFNLRTKTWTKYQFETVGRLNSVWTDGKGFYVAVGDNGVIYTKESSNSDWVFSRMEDEFNLSKVSGISKTEWYVSGYKYPTPSSVSNNKIYRYLNGSYLTLYDTYNLETSILPLYASSLVTRLDAIRCEKMDSLYLFVSGIEHVKLTSYSTELMFKPTSLSRLSTGVNEITSTSPNVFALTPNDVWVPTLRFGFYHYNGLDVKKIESIPNLNYGDISRTGLLRQIKKSASGKIWMLIESNTQQYLLIQGTPL